MPNNYTTMAIRSPGYDFDVKSFNEQHAETNLCAVVKPMPENIEQIPSISYSDGTTEKERRGVEQDWYYWAKKNWGTKWGTYNVAAFSLGGDYNPIMVKFQSAWGPPKLLDEIAEWLKRVGKFEQVDWVGFDPFDGKTYLLTKEDYCE